MKRRRMHYTELRWLTPDTRDQIAIFIKRLALLGLSPSVAETYRPQSRQDQIVRQSAALVAAGKAPLTKTSHSWHSVGRAADINISPATQENILQFLDLATELGLHTLADPDKVRAAIASGDSKALNAALWDWHHVEFRNGRDYAHAASEFVALQKRGPMPGPELADILSGTMMLGAISGAIAKGATHG